MSVLHITDPVLSHTMTIPCVVKEVQLCPLSVIALPYENLNYQGKRSFPREFDFAADTC